MLGDRLRALLVEDNVADAELAERELRRAGLSLETRRVETREQYREALASFAPDVVLCDYRLPGFDGLVALRMLQQAAPRVPFILVTGSLDEETAVEIMKAGASDYLLKDRIGRLGPAVLAALEHRKIVEGKLRVESEVRLQAELLRNVFDQIPVLVLIHDREGHPILLNHACERVFGTPARAGGHNLWLEAHPEEEQRERARQFLSAAAATWADFSLRSSDGAPVDVTAMCLGLSDGSSLLIALDVSERRRAETALRQAQEQLLQSQKMEAVGLLAGGVAHDFNNILGIIIGYSELLLRDLPENDPRRQRAAEVFEAAGRAAALTRQLLAFSRKQVLQPQIVDLSSIVANVARMLERLIGEDIELVLDLEQGLASVLVDPGQVEQVLLNLAVNARDAMPQGGALTIHTASVTLDEAFCQRHPALRPGPHVLLRVSDTGSGIAPELRSRIFDPFFTTKAPGKGTGLGLSTVYGIVEQSGGTIEVASELGRGAAFSIHLPVTDATVHAGTRPEPTLAGAVRGGILLVEDDDALREVVEELLRSEGHRVFGAANAARALEIFKEQQEAIDLVISDVVLPGMSGREMAETVLALRPSTRLLFTSGYAADTVLRHGVREGAVAFLQKPFSAAVLARKVREVLGARADGRPTQPGS